MKKVHSHLEKILAVVLVSMSFQAAVYAAQYYRVSNG